MAKVTASPLRSSRGKVTELCLSVHTSDACCCCGQFLVAAVWSAAEIALRIVTRLRSGLHPGTHIATSMLLWVGAGVSLGFVVNVQFANDRDDHNCETFTQPLAIETCRGDYPRVRPLITMTAALLCVNLLLYMGLSISACCDVHARQRLKGTQRC